MDKLLVIKIGGNVLDDEAKLSKVLTQIARCRQKIILVHGGGKMATRLADQLDIPQQMVEGRRITDAETLKIVTMVYAGLINKQVVAQLQAYGAHAFGLCGADGNAILSHQRVRAGLDYGFAGDIDQVNTTLFQNLLEHHLLPVVAPITHDARGQLLNTNADTIAGEIARAMSAHFETSLIYSFEKKGVLLDADDEDSVISRIDRETFHRLKNEGRIFSGMIPKLDNAFAAIDRGVHRVLIGKAEDLENLLQNQSGTEVKNG